MREAVWKLRRGASDGRRKSLTGGPKVLGAGFFVIQRSRQSTATSDF
jgi:hypothetical protein